MKEAANSGGAFWSSRYLIEGKLQLCSSLLAILF